MNRYECIGRNVRDIELRTTSNGNSVIHFTVAVDRRTEGTDFIPITAYGKCAEVTAQYVKKGYLIFVSGHVQTGSYEKEGKKIYTQDIVADSVRFLWDKKSDNSVKDEPIISNDFDLPFD